MSPVGDRGSAKEAQCAGTVGLESHIAVAQKFPGRDVSLRLSHQPAPVDPMSSSAISLVRNCCFVARLLLATSPIFCVVLGVGTANSTLLWSGVAPDLREAGTCSVVVYTGWPEADSVSKRFDRCLVLHYVLFPLKAMAV